VFVIKSHVQHFDYQALNYANSLFTISLDHHVDIMAYCTEGWQPQVMFTHSFLAYNTCVFTKSVSVLALAVELTDRHTYFVNWFLRMKKDNFIVYGLLFISTYSVELIITFNNFLSFLLKTQSVTAFN